MLAASGSACLKTQASARPWRLELVDQSRPGISHRDEHVVHRIARTADQQLSRPHYAHCFHGVDDQVQQHLLQLDVMMAD
jgi:hypothetical protein